MPFLLGAAAVVSMGIGLRNSAKAKRLAKQEGIAQTSDMQREAGIAESALLEQAKATDAQRGFIAERLLLQEQQETEAGRQARQPGVDFTLGGSGGFRDAQKRRTQFFDYGGGV